MPPTRAHAPRLALVAGAIILTSLNLRTAIASVPPLLDEISAAVPLSGAGAGALTTVPVICMALGSPVAPPLARRVGIEGALAFMALTVAAGIALRLVGGVVPLFAGTIVAGLGIALGNVLVPSVIKRDFPRHVGTMTGAYTMSLSASGALGAALTIPLEDAIGHGWRWGLAVWAIPAAAVAALWLPGAVRGAVAARGIIHVTPNLWRNRLAWQVTAFMGLQSLQFYSVLSWLPALMRSEGIDRETAGALLSVFMLTGIPAGLVMPVLAGRGRDQRRAVTIALAAFGAGLVGLLVAPTAAPAVWAVLMGVAQGATLSLAFLFFALRTPDQAHAAELAAMAQTVGYLVAAAGPLVVGVLRDLTGGWTAPLVFLIAMLVPAVAAGRAAGRSRII